MPDAPNQPDPTPVQLIDVSIERAKRFLEGGGANPKQAAMNLNRARFQLKKIYGEDHALLRHMDPLTSADLEENPRQVIQEHLQRMISIREGLEFAAQRGLKSSSGRKVFIGHGASPAWWELNEFLEKRLKVEVEEFNRAPVAGTTTVERIETMLSQAFFAFLVMTAEDERTDGTIQPRMNVVHETGLFQGRLGARRAIVLLEDGCSEFSNIHGLSQIRFPKGAISAAFEEIRRVFEREGLIRVK